MFDKKSGAQPTRRRALIGRLTLASAALALIACGDVTRPLPSAPSGPIFSRDDAPNRSEGLVVCAPRPVRQHDEKIGPRGGILAVGGNFLIVPAGALTTTVEISATVSPGARAMVEFEPHGLQFKVAPLLVLNAAGCAIPPHSHPVLAYVDDEGKILDRIDGLLGPGQFFFSAPIHHFSGYAIAF